ncbi:uncharacterized protein CEXT_370862 [Caerostris extrusa]|uniref:Uncharacterized protein n=1 Tax=Caerostris extrusa TaxID=172846 RepID=A0AAV4XDV8_CAEEX|nr:uncharacterized protein CEXT_370862 [Caerostris extrusa]
MVKLAVCGVVEVSPSVWNSGGSEIVGGEVGSGWSGRGRAGSTDLPLPPARPHPGHVRRRHRPATGAARETAGGVPVGRLGHRAALTRIPKGGEHPQEGGGGAGEVLSRAGRLRPYLGQGAAPHPAPVPRLPPRPGPRRCEGVPLHPDGRDGLEEEPIPAEGHAPSPQRHAHREVLQGDGHASSLRRHAHREVLQGEGQLAGAGRRNPESSRFRCGTPPGRRSGPHFGLSHFVPQGGRALTHRFVPSQGDPGSKVSLDETSDLPDGYCDEETLFRKSSNLFCYIAAILAVACIGGGVLMGVIFMMIQ